MDQLNALERTGKQIARAVNIAQKMLLNDIDDQGFATLYFTIKAGQVLFDEINDGWYLLNKYNIWKETQNGVALIEDMSHSIAPIIEKAFQKLRAEHLVTEDVQKRYKRALHAINTHHTKKNILNELKGKFPENRVFEKMDRVNDYLFAFDNGVYDLKENRFRLPKPDELITVTCGYDYMSPNAVIRKIMRDLQNIIDSLMPNRDDSHTLLTQIAMKLTAIPVEELYVWLGSGGNGKGLLRDVIAQTFGAYFDPMEVDYLVKSKHGQSATAADEVMAKKKNARVVLTSEPESDMDIRIGKIKNITGGDPVQCRFNYGSNFNYVPKFGLFIMTNYSITIKNAGYEIRRRLRVIRFPLNFCANPVLENDRKADPTLKQRIKNPLYKIAFFHLLLEKYNQCASNDFVIPISENIKEETEIFLNGYDPFTPFFKDVIEKTGDDSSFIKLTDLHKAFKAYYTGESSCTLNHQELRKAVESKGLMVKIKNGYNGIRGIRINQDKLNERMKGKDKDDNSDDYIEV